MAERLLSVGLDVGTTSSQMVLSELLVENRAGAFSVPEMEIGSRRVLYKSPVHLTPLLRGELVDAAALRRIIEGEYRNAGLRREDVDTGAIIITGETSRKENAEAVLHQLSGFAGDFVVAAAGPELESVLAARGAGADRFSQDSGKTVLHMDIGGGTTNLALIRQGKILKTGCLNVGGRLLKLDWDGVIRYCSPVLEGLTDLRPGRQASENQLAQIGQILVRALEMAAGLRHRTQLLDRLWTREMNAPPWVADAPAVISFSGGVADCVQKDYPWLTFGDMGPVLGRCIRGSRLCRGEYRLGEETIRATVIGAGCHSAQLSGSTVFFRNVSFPLKNLEAVCALEQWSIRREPGVLTLAGPEGADYASVVSLAERILAERSGGPVYVCLERDMAKALGQALAVRAEPGREILCIDRVRLREGSYLDVGAPVGPALPVVIKTLVMGPVDEKEREG